MTEPELEYSQWTVPHRAGLLPAIFLQGDPRTPQEQANERYAHGGGWSNQWFAKHRNDWALEILEPGNAKIFYRDAAMREDGEEAEIMHEVTRAQLGDCTIIMFASAMVAIIEPDGAWDLARMD